MAKYLIKDGQNILLPTLEGSLKNVGSGVATSSMFNDSLLTINEIVSEKTTKIKAMDYSKDLEEGKVYVSSFTSLSYPIVERIDIV